jgi:hypothetical protein
MIWDAVTAGYKGVKFLAGLCSDVYSVYADVKRVYDDHIQPGLDLLGVAGKDALQSVMEKVDTLHGTKEKLLFANKAECREMAERVVLLAESLDQLSREIPKPAPAVEGCIRQLAAALAEVTKLIAANAMPVKLSWFGKQKWLIHQGRKRDEVRTNLAKQGEHMQRAVQQLAFGLQVQTAGQNQSASDLVKMSAKANATSNALNRSDLIEWQQQNQEAIADEMKRWTEGQKREMENGFHQLLDSLEVHAKQHTLQMPIGFLQNQTGIQAGNEKLDQLLKAVQRLEVASPSSPTANAAWKYQFTVLQMAALEIDWDDEDTACIGEGAAGEVWKGTMQNAGEAVAIAFKKLSLTKGLSAADKGMPFFGW